MSEGLKLLGSFIAFLIILAAIAWIFWRALRKSHEPAALITRWIITGGILFVMIKWTIPLALMIPAVGVPLTALCAVIMGLMWAPNWGAMLAKPFTSAIDGGDEEPEETPIYSFAETKRKRGLYREAVEEVRKQLVKFPHDYRGQLLLAEIQAEDLNDLQGAQVTINRLLNQKHAPGHVASALHALADWHMKFGQDPDSARETLERIAVLLPNSQYAQVAAQRIARLTPMDQLIHAKDPTKIEMGTYNQFVGLKKAEPEEVAAPDNAGKAAELVKHLTDHPNDAEAREKLAVAYAEEFNRLDLSVLELEQLIAQPHHPPKRVAHWLNLMAELQITYANDLEGAKKSVGRIMEKFPKTALADQALLRQANLKQESKKNEKSQTVQLGSYDKYLGLKLQRNVRAPEGQQNSSTGTD